jgi:AsmA protein
MVSIVGFKAPFSENLAKDYWRQALAGLFIVLFMLASLVGLALFTLEANLFKSQIVDYVKTTKQRDLKLDGDIELTYFPRLGLNFGKATLSQRNSAQKFASVDNARVYVAWWPLLFKQVEIERIVLDGLQAQVTRYKNGSSDLDDLFITDGALSGIEFKIEKIRVIDARLDLRDEKSDLTLALSELNLEAGKIAEKHPGELSASFRVQSETPRINSRIKLAGHVIFDRSANRYELANLEGNLQGELLRLSSVALDFHGSLIVNQAAKQLALDKLGATLAGLLDKRKLEAKLDVASLKLDLNNQFSATALVLTASAKQDNDSSSLALDVPGLVIKEGKFDAALVQGMFDLTQAGLSSQGKFSSPLNYSFETHQLQMPGLESSYSLMHPLLLVKLNASTTGDLQLGLDEQDLRLSFKTKLDESQFTGSLRLQDFSSPRYTVDVQANTLDLDRYLAIDWYKRLQDDSAPLDWSALKTLNLRGKLRTPGDLRLARIKAREFSTELRVDASGLNFDNLSAKLYGGTMSGNLSLVPSEVPQLALKQKWTGVQFNSLLADFLGAEPWLLARGNLALELSSEGANPVALRKALTGSASLQLTRGTLAGLNLVDALIGLRDQVGLKDAERDVPARKTEATAFNELKANIDFLQGQVRSQDLQIRSANFSSKGEVQAPLDSGQLLFKGSTTVASNLRRSMVGDIADLSGVTIPLRVTSTSAGHSFNFSPGEASGGNTERLLKVNQARVAPSPSANASAPVSAQAPSRSSSTPVKNGALKAAAAK